MHAVHLFMQSCVPYKGTRWISRTPAYCALCLALRLSPRLCSVSGELLFGLLSYLGQKLDLNFQPSMCCSSPTGPAAEQVLLLENIATSIKIGPEQLPSVYRLLIEAVRFARMVHVVACRAACKGPLVTPGIVVSSAQAEILQMEPPELYVRQVCCCHVLTRSQADLSSDSANQPAAMLILGCCVTESHPQRIHAGNSRAAAVHCHPHGVAGVADTQGAAGSGKWRAIRTRPHSHMSVLPLN